MRLQSALTMNQFEGLDEDEDFGSLFKSKEERQERRSERRSKRKTRRSERRTKRHDRKASRLRRKARKLDPGGGQRRRRGGGGGGGGGSGGGQPTSPRRAMRRGGKRRGMGPMGSPEDMQMEQALEPISPSQELGPEFYEPFDPAEFEDEFEDALELEGIGAVTRRWSPLARMGPNFRIQAAQGYRAAVIELKPGLFVVAELPEHVARSEFGVLPLLAPLVIRATSRALSKPKEERVIPKLLQRARENQGDGQRRPLLSMFQRQGQDHGQAQARRRLLPAPGSGRGQRQLLPTPVLGRWVDDDDLASLMDDDDDWGG